MKEKNLQARSSVTDSRKDYLFLESLFLESEVLRTVIASEKRLKWV